MAQSPNYQTELLGDAELTDLFLDVSDEEASPKVDEGSRAAAASAMTEPEAAITMAAKLKELQAQLVALAIDNDALRARAEQREAELEQMRRRQQQQQQKQQPLAEEPKLLAQDPSVESMGRIPRVLARLRRRNTVASAATVRGTLSDADVPAGLRKQSDPMLTPAEEAEDEEDEEQEAAKEPDDVAATGGEERRGSLAGRAQRWFLSGLLSLLDDMQAPTDAEKLLLASADEQLSAKKLKVNVTRFGRNTQPIFACVEGFVKVVRWRTPSYTALVMLLYYFALLNNYLLPLLLLLCILRLLLNYMKYRLNWELDFNFVAEYDQSDGSEDGSGGTEKERTVGTQVNFVVHVAKKVQILTGKISDNLEKFKNLVTWRSPQYTQLLLNALIVAFILSLLVPTTTYIFYCGFYLGIKFFIIDAIFFKYPRLRRKYDSVDRIWRSLPTDQQMGYHQTNKDVEKYILPYSDEDTKQACSVEGGRRPDRGSSPLCSDDEEFCQAFALPNLECPLARWRGGKRCAIICKEADRALPDSLKHGKLFLTRSFLCFERGKDRGKAKKRNIVIPLTMIQWVKKTKPFAWLPGGGMAIEVQIRGMEKAITFGAIIGRDELFDSMMETGRRASLPWATTTLAASAATATGGVLIETSSSSSMATDAAAASTTAVGGLPQQSTAASVSDENLAVAGGALPSPPPDLDLVQSVREALLSDSDTDD